MSDAQKHAILSPSGADRWMICPGSVALTKDLVNPSSAFSVEGTDYHEVAAYCLENKIDAVECVGREMPSGAFATDENCEYVQKYLDLVRGYLAQGGSLRVEERVPIGHLTGEVGAEGTADAVILREDDELIIIDLKFGRGVEVAVADNRQLKLYALGVLEKHALSDEYKTIRMVICQPRSAGTSEWVCSIADLLAFGDVVKEVAKPILVRLANPKATLDPLPLVPSEKGCRFCLARGTCSALRSSVEQARTEGFTSEMAEDVLKTKTVPPTATGEILSAAMKKIDLVEIWAKGVRTALELTLLQGVSVPDWKLVQGKKGNRAWTSVQEAEALFKSFRLKHEQMYTSKLISPTAAEKLLGESEKRWVKVNALITQPPGQPSVAPETDPRPAIVIGSPEEGFEVVEDYSDIL